MVVRARGKACGAPLTTLSETSKGLAWPEDTKANWTGSVEQYRMEKNLERENSNRKDQTTGSITASNHRRTNGHRSLETRLEEGGR